MGDPSSLPQFSTHEGIDEVLCYQSRRCLQDCVQVSFVVSSEA